MAEGKQKSGVCMFFAGNSGVVEKIALAVWEKWNGHLISICKIELERRKSAVTKVEKRLLIDRTTKIQVVSVSF